MQLSGPRKCPDCNDGKKGDKLCIVCRGSGWVYLVPAERLHIPVPGEFSFSEQMAKMRDEDIYA
jgi:hypothetical protein